jgi:hypothetical protein
MKVIRVPAQYSGAVRVPAISSVSTIHLAGITPLHRK